MQFSFINIWDLMICDMFRVDMFRVESAAWNNQTHKDLSFANFETLFIIHRKQVHFF